MELENWKKIVAAILGIVTFGLLMYGVYSDISSASEEIKIPLSTAVEKLAANNGMNVSKKAYLINQFSEARGLGGAGGIGNDVIGALGAEDFIATAKKEGLTEIYYTFEEKNLGLVKKYWAPSPKGVFEWSEMHKPQIGAATYSLAGYDENTATFAKATLWTWILVTIILAIAGLIVYIVVYFILCFAERLYSFIRHGS